MTTLRGGHLRAPSLRDAASPPCGSPSRRAGTPGVGPNRFEGLSDRATGPGRSTRRCWSRIRTGTLGLLVLDVEWIAQPGCTMADVTGDDTAALVQALTRRPRSRGDLRPREHGPLRPPRRAPAAAGAGRRRRVPGRRRPCIGAVSAGIGYLGRGTTYDAWVIDVDGDRSCVWATWTRGRPQRRGGRRCSGSSTPSSSTTPGSRPGSSCRLEGRPGTSCAFTPEVPGRRV